MADKVPVVGLDLGATKACAVLAERAEGSVDIIGVGHSPCDGLRRGVVVDVDKTVQAVLRAVREAELMAGGAVETVYAGIAGEHIRSLDSTGSIATPDSLEITESDRQRVIDAARAVAIPFDRQVLHVLPQQYTVDGRTGIRDPVGMSGVRLESSVHIVTGAVTAVQNICKSVRRAEITVGELVLESLASSRAVLLDEEKEMGVCLVDVGGGTTDLAIFTEGAVRRTTVIGVGGQNVTNDLAICLRSSWPVAEDLKCRFGIALSGLVEESEVVEVAGVAGRPPAVAPRSRLAAIVEARMEEIMMLVLREIKASGYSSQLGAGIVLTGGGALVVGVVELAERVFGMPVRLGVPTGFGGGLGDRVANPVFSTALGLVLMACDQAGPAVRAAGYEGTALSEGRFEAAAGRMKEWITTHL